MSTKGLKKLDLEYKSLVKIWCRIFEFDLALTWVLAWVGFWFDLSLDAN